MVRGKAVVGGFQSADPQGIVRQVAFSGSVAGNVSQWGFLPELELTLVLGKLSKITCRFFSKPRTLIGC